MESNTSSGWQLLPDASGRQQLPAVEAVQEPEREFRVMGDGRLWAVAELTEKEGLVVRIGGLLRWQALGIVAILHHPFND